MKIVFGSRTRGIALIVVMVAVFVLTALVSAFAYFMKIETQLALNSRRETKLIWTARSGVDYARWFLANSPPQCEPFDALNQQWALGPGSACASNNNVLAGLTMKGPHQLDDDCWFTIVDCKDLERKFNINMADEKI